MNLNGPTRDSRDQDDDVVVRRVEHGWVVRGEEVSDLTSAMVLADLFAADQEQAAYEEGRAAGSGQSAGSSAVGRHRSASQVQPPFVPGKEIADDEAARLAVTVAQLEHALASRVRVEQAIGVLAERHRLRPREAFDLLRGAARSRGARITEMAQDVVASTANPLLRLPEELARQLPTQVKQRGRSIRRTRAEKSLPRDRRFPARGKPVLLGKRGQDEGGHGGLATGVGVEG